MELIPSLLQRYAEAHTSPEPQALKKINRDTQAQVLMGRMVSGHLQGRFLSMVSQLARPHNILEIGTFTGYSAICLAEGLGPDGTLITLEANEELEGRIRNNIALAGMTGKIDLKIGKAAELIPTLDKMFDLVFIDADKANYSLYYDLVFDKTKIGGLILADNVLWDGKVLNEKPDKDTRAIQGFNDKVANDKRIEHLLLPLRDGIMLIRKVSL